MYLKIAEEFSMIPGCRYKEDGPFSGEQFRDDFLIPTYNECINNNEKLIIDFDGGYGYPSGFVEETFGGLIRKGYNLKQFYELVTIISTEDDTLVDQINKFMNEENERTNGKLRIRSLLERRKVKHERNNK